MSSPKRCTLWYVTFNDGSIYTVYADSEIEAKRLAYVKRKVDKAFG